MEAKAIKKPPQQKHQKHYSPNDPKVVPKGSQNGAQIIKNKSWKHHVSKVAPKWPPEPLQNQFWKGFVTIVGPFVSVFSDTFF